MISPCHAFSPRGWRAGSRHRNRGIETRREWHIRPAAAGSAPGHRAIASHRPDRNRRRGEGGGAGGGVRRGGITGKRTGSPGNNSPWCDVAPRCRPSASIRGKTAPSAWGGAPSFPGPLLAPPAAPFRVGGASAGVPSGSRRNDEVEVFRNAAHNVPLSGSRASASRSTTSPRPLVRHPDESESAGHGPGARHRQGRDRAASPRSVRAISPFAAVRNQRGKAGQNQPCDDLSLPRADKGSSAPVHALTLVNRG